MLQPHSLLWHYLWLGPHILQAILAVLLWRRGLHKAFPVFFTYVVFEATEEFALYAMDVLPSVSGKTFWLAYWVGLVVETILMVAVIGELFSHLLRPRQFIAKWGGRAISGVGAMLMLLATLAAAFTPVVSRQLTLISGAGIFKQSSYIVESGLVVFLFSFAAYHKLTWDRRGLGIALGFGIVWCEHLAALALIASGTWLDRRLEFLNMATYHLCVLIWFYYLLVPQESATTSAVSLPENDLDIWNRELERLLQQ
jgi:hypothetical protein